MGILDALRGLPRWAKKLPRHLRPSANQIQRLEALRTEFGVTDAEFLMHIASHPQTTRRVQRHFYKEIKSQMPGASETERLKHLIDSRLMAALGQGSDLFDLGSLVDEEEMLNARVEEIVFRHGDLESLIGAMIEDEERRELSIPAAKGFEDAVRRVNEILSET